MTTPWIDAAREALITERFALAEAEQRVADRPGLYAIFGEPATWQQLGLGVPRDDRPLYVGKAEDSLVARDVRTHFRAGRTGQSTVRRTFAALLRDELALRGMPRNPEAPERLGNYALSPEHDEKLNAWMFERLRLAVWTKPDGCTDLGAVERALFDAWKPPLNLKDNRTQWQQRIEHARKRMSDDARAWAAERQLAIKPRS